MISNDAVEVEFKERNGLNKSAFNQLAVLIPDSTSPFLSGKIDVDTVSCTAVGSDDNRHKPRMQKCVISLNKLNADQKRRLKGACL
jgi:hypothetical protein